MKAMKKNKDYTISSGNIFADLELPDSQDRLTKADLASQINKLIEGKGLTQTAAAQLLGIDQPKISALNTGNLSGFSLERLFRFLNILDQDITIQITPKTHSKKNAYVVVSISKTKKVPARKNPSTQSHTRTIQARKKSKIV